MSSGSHEGAAASPRRSGRFAQAVAEEFQLLVENVKDYAIFMLDPSGKVMSWNAGAERIKGYSADEILGEHFSRFYEPQAQAAGRPAAALETARREGRFEGYGWRVRKDGTRFFAHVTITSLYDQDGVLHGFAKVTQDVTAQRETERMLREREQQLAEAQALAQLGNFEWDPGARQVIWSPELCQILGLEPRTFRSTLRELVGYIHPDDRALVVQAIRGAASRGTPFRMEQRAVRPDGEVRFLLIWGRASADEEGRVRRVVCVCQDLTEQREGELELAEAHAQAELSRQLQRGLLPTLSLHDPSLVLRTRYLPGQERALLGADFYDALELPDGTVATLIGDVAGHGPDEAAVGGALRAAWQGLVLSGHGPAAVLSGLDRVLAYNRPSEEMFTTVFCTWISPDRTSVTLASAGHPPPLLLSAGQVRVEEVPGGPALGIHDDGYAWESKTLEVGAGWTLLCYTDGLVEGLSSPGSVERFGIEALVETVAGLLASGDELDAVLDGLLEAVRGANGGDLSDDVAILCCSRSPLATAPGLLAPAGDGQAAAATPF